MTDQRNELLCVIFGDVQAELGFAFNHGDFSSPHEAYAVLLEEVEEYWDEVRKKRNARSKARMREELIQVAAVAIKGIVALEEP